MGHSTNAEEWKVTKRLASTRVSSRLLRGLSLGCATEWNSNATGNQTLADKSTLEIETSFVAMEFHCFPMRLSQ